MSNSENNIHSDNESNSQNSLFSSFDWKEYLSLLWNAKLWIAICIVIGAGAGYYIYKIQQTKYGAEAEMMLLLDDQDSFGGSGASAVLAEFSNVQSGNTSLSNERELMTSPALIAQVVDHLNLNTTYTAPGFGHEDDLYGKTPVLVHFLELSNDSSASMRIYKSRPGSVIATDFKLNGKHVESKPLRIPLGAVVKSPFGLLAISPTSDFNKFPEYISIQRTPTASTATLVADRIKTAQKADDNTVVVLAYEDVSGARAVDILNSLLDTYNDLWKTEQSRSALSTSNFINERIDVIEKELNGIDSDISHVKSASQIADFNDAANSFYQQSITYDSKAFDTSTQLSIAQFLRDFIRESTNDNVMIPTNTGTTGSVESQIQEYNKMVAKRNNLLQNSTEANPLIAQLSSDLASSRALILASLNNIIASLQIEASRAQDRGRNYSGKISAVPEREKQILSIERQQKVKEQLYLYLLQKREENKLGKLVTVEHTRILRKAAPTGIKSRPLSNFIVLGALFGLLLPLLAIYLYTLLNTRITRRSELKGLTIPFLGEMPLTSKKAARKSRILRLLGSKSRKADDKKLEIVVKPRSRSYINEAFRMIRTNLDFVSKTTEGCEVIMLTSFNPGSGKTFISMNLAKSLALTDKRVLLIDMDMRRASLSATAGNETQGLSAYLTGKVTDIFSLISFNNNNQGIDILPVGALPPNPVELALSQRMEELIDDLRQEYDYIVLDCPPYDLVADTAIISRVADMTIFIIRAGLFNKAMVGDLEALYQNDKLPRMSMILNGIDPKKSYYSKRYGYNAADGYYVEDDSEK